MFDPSLLSMLIPAIPTLAAVSVCKVSKESGEGLKFRPPSYVFAWMWSALFICLGIAFYRTQVKWPILLLSLGLGSWVVMYSSNCGARKVQATWVLAACIWFGLMVVSFSAFEGDAFNIAASSAALAWLIFAQFMNVLEAQSAFTSQASSNRD